MKIWFLPSKNYELVESSLGPYSTNEILDLIKKDDLRIDDFIWAETLKENRWHRLFEIDEFKNLLKKYPNVKLPKTHSSGLKFKQLETLKFKEQRRYPRVDLNAKAIIHNNIQYEQTNCFDISEKGLFLRTENTYLFEQGEEVIITVRNAEDIGTFSADSVIIRVQNPPMLTGYGIQFLRLNPKIRQSIAKYIIKNSELIFEEKEQI
jgi:hypothetical protein